MSDFFVPLIRRLLLTLVLMEFDFRTRATLALTIAATYVATHLPLAVTALVTYPLIARGDVYLDWPTLCQVDAIHII